MLDRVQSISSIWRWNGYANLALAMISQAAVDLRTRTSQSAVEWFFSADFELMAECLGLNSEKLKFDIIHYQFIERKQGTSMVRTFTLIRTADVGGVSGTGVVAEGAVFRNGKTILCWTRAPHSVTVFNSPDEVLLVHGHGGSTQLQWDKSEVEECQTLAETTPFRIKKDRTESLQFPCGLS